MKKEDALKAIAVLSGVGVLFSGYLTAQEFGSGLSCAAGTVKILGLPACIYGFGMYVLILALALWALYKTN